MRYFLDPFGCVKNQVDAENMMAHLNNAGWEPVSEEDADLIIVNSCGFIESAKQESIDAVLQWRNLYPKKKILLAGCLAQRYATELPKNLQEADGFFGVENISGIVQAAKSLFNDKGKSRRKLAQNDSIIAHHTGDRPLLSLPGSAYIKISEGCNNNCSYCAIPLIRGILKSRTIPGIMDEFRTLLKRGIKEICIVGQDIGSFGIDTHNRSLLPHLLKEISNTEGQFWVRLLYIHPDHFPLQILDVMESDSRILPYFDIPFQHSSAEILAAMNRRGTSKKYLDLIRTIRARLQGAVIRSTFMLGFPGETEEDFSALLDFQEKAALDWVGCFAFSREEGTAAWNMKGRIAAKTAVMRKQLIEERQIAVTEKNIDRFTGKTFDVLLEEKIELLPDSKEKSSHQDEIWLGRLYCQAPEIDSTVVITGTRDGFKAGTFVPCKIIARRGFDLEAKIASLY